MGENKSYQAQQGCVWFLIFVLLVLGLAGYGCATLLQDDSKDAPPQSLGWG